MPINNWIRLPAHFTLAKNGLSHGNDFEVGWISTNNLKMNRPMYPVTESLQMYTNRILCLQRGKGKKKLARLAETIFSAIV